jgi:hypothetical protein
MSDASAVEHSNVITLEQKLSLHVFFSPIVAL